MNHSALRGIASFIFALTLSVTAWAQYAETVLYNFAGQPDGQMPSGFIADASGNFFGVTQFGGANGFGSVFELSPVSGGGWSETVLYSFVGGASGQTPQGALALDAAGNLYGAAWTGNPGLGIVYKLTSTKIGWQQTILHAFTGGSDGGVPYSGVTLDASGNVYGTTFSGGKSDCFDESPCGVVYKLSFVRNVGWKEAVLHSFTGRDGANPRATPLLNASGNLYGTTAYGGWVSQKGFCGMLGCGVAYELSPTTGGWKETVIHTFVDGLADGGFPAAGFVPDASGNLYGATTSGGSYIECGYGSGCGTIFELSPSSTGTWAETILHRFNGRDGANPYATPVLDEAGNVYGPAAAGVYGFGAAYELSPSSSGWVFSVIFDFSSFQTGGGSSSSFVLDHSGNLYGTSGVGGDNSNSQCVDGCGLIFELTP